MIPCSSIFQNTWSQRVSDLQFRIYNETTGKYLTVIGYTVSRRRDYKLANVLIGESSITALGRVSDFNINNKFTVQAGFNSEYITIFTGYVDRISENVKNKTVTIKARDKMKLYDRAVISPNEQVNQRVKALLDVVSTEANVPIGDRVFDDPVIFVDYFAPKKQKALDEVRKLTEATVMSEFYAREDDKVIFNSYVPSTQFEETWDTDTDWLTKYTSLTKMDISGSKLVCHPDESDKASTQAVDKPWSWSTGTPLDLALYTQSLKVTYIAPTILKSITLYQKAALPVGEVFTSAKIRIYARLNGSTSLVYQDSSVALAQALSAGFSPTTITYNLAAKGDQFIIDIQASRSGSWSSYSQPHAIEGREITGVTGAMEIGQTTFAFYRGSIKIHELTSDVGVSAFVTTDNTACTYESATINASANNVGVFEVFDSGATGWAYEVGYSADDISYTWVSTTKNSIPVVPGTTYYRWRVSITTRLFEYIDKITFNWWAASGNDLYNKPVTFYFEDPQIKTVTRIKTDELGGDNALVNLANVTAQPKYVAAAATDVWVGTTGQQPISGTNPLTITAPELPYTLVVDFGQPVQEASQSLVITWSSGGSTVTYTAHPNNPTIVIGSAGVITQLKVTGKVIVEDAAISASSEDAASIASYGEASVSVDDEYINQPGIAQSIADELVKRYAQPREIFDMGVKFTPHIQLGEMFIMTSVAFGLRFRCYVLEIQHSLTSSKDTFSADTRVKALILEEIPLTYPLSMYFLNIREFATPQVFVDTCDLHELGWCWDDDHNGGQLMTIKANGELVVVSMPYKLQAISTAKYILAQYTDLDDLKLNAPLDTVCEAVSDTDDGTTQIFYKSRTGDIYTVG